jgi:uncharacterized membrane protein
MNLNPAHWHLLINHLPIVGTFIAVLVLATGIIGKRQSVIKTSYLLFILMAVFSILASQTGEKAEHYLIDLKLADHDLIETHVEASGIAQWALIAVALFSLAALLVKKLKSSKAVPVVILLLSLVVAGLMFRTGMLGGLIMHKEIRPEAAGAVK